jgi:hypothetical protein
MNKLRRRLAQTRTLQLEQLERRSCLTAITASLSAQGVLQIQGTTGNDNIALTLASSQVSISGVTTRFAAAQVKSVSISTLAGNDVVNLSGLGTAWKAPITVTNSAGSDQAIATNKSAIFFAAGTFAQSATGAPTLNTRPLDWFDSNIRDDALRAILKTGYADKAISRAEMLAVFTQVKKDGVVSATEFSDLSATANNASLFTSVDYVGVLTKDVVLGNAANAKYQGTTLGNLKAGASAAQLDKLVGKWFL